MTQETDMNDKPEDGVYVRVSKVLGNSVVILYE